jgi:hypothetical protein
MATFSILSEEALQADRMIGFADPTTRARGQTYFMQRRARLRTLEPTEAIFQVQGSQLYEVVIWLDAGQIRMTCSCPVGGDEDAPCKHEVAALLALRSYLRLNPPTTWETVLEKAVSQKIRRSGPGVAKLLIVFSLQRRYSEWSVAPYSLALSYFPADIDPMNVEAVAKVIHQQRLGQQAKTVRSLGNAKRFVNLTDDTRIAVQMAAMQYRYSYNYSEEGESGLAAILPHLLSAALFVGSENAPLQKRLLVAPEPTKPELHISETDDGLRLYPRVKVAGQRLALDAKNTVIICQSPLWQQTGALLYSVDDPSGTFLTFVQTPDLLVPPEEKDAFLARYLLPLAERLPITGLSITQEEVCADKLSYASATASTN